MAKTKWWQNSIAYQVYPRSFQDTNNDGIGDIGGIIERLDYLKSLGINILWISPIYKSPMVDMGYDIADYQAIDPQFGTMADFDRLSAECDKRGIKIVMDLVINHTSDQHDWFKKALADKNSKYRNYYIFKKTTNGKVPNNWRSIFGGSTWTEVPGEPGTYYFHTFARQQPDLNWENSVLRHEIYDMINWWLDKGVSGYRCDAITHLKKDLDWASLEPDGNDGLVAVIKKGQNRPGIDFFLEELKRETFDKYDAVTIGEAYGVPDEDLPKYIGEDGYFSMIFDFSYLNIEVKNVDEWYQGRSNWTISDLKKTIFDSQKSIENAHGISANVLENHDQPRTLSKLIVKKEHQTPTAAKALATMYYFLPGVPFIYQGQEVGMKNMQRKTISEFNDVSTINNYQMALREGYSEDDALELVNYKSRDNARTPMQWDSSKYAGFSGVKPWLSMGTDRKGIDVADEKNNDESVLTFYRNLAVLRNDIQFHETIISGNLFEIVDVPEDVVGYKRETDSQTLTILVNLSNEEQEIKLMNPGLIVCSNISVDDNNVGGIYILKPFQAIVINE
ncbi:glycoside hydrolase family 13 protein [Dellaglioa algida]|uniref:glycoside hydrolase family 13 protein n=1 Tax=Dellaglioa algida TaxID=105612 RepID=UPI0024C4B5D4|nr:alpha-glucosidase [Dellaglioa algida]MDK1727431.1 alpha-glucosidase [Dellaglioa algida]MDK1735443.1 alpha-glucosidase [Dellaglioa algida]MDK1736754.1 alpha-glucosidase [Dellaglioa algida]